VTIAHYFTPNGTDIHHKGIIPDVVVPLTKAQIKTLSDNPKLLASQSDPQYVKAVQSVSKLIQSNAGSTVPAVSSGANLAKPQPSLNQ
jgi:carboxyl-terminal processing protease